MLHHGMSVCASHNTVVDASTQRSTTRGSFTVTGGESSSPVSNGAFAGVVAKAKEEASRGNKLVTHKFETQDPPKRRRSSRSSRFSAPAPIIDLPEDDEEDVEEEAPRCIILPDSTFRLTWDFVMLVLILYNVFAVPVSICFSIDSHPTHPWFWFELLFDIIFLIDIGVNFNTAVQTETGLVTDRYSIARTYFSFWFWIDFPSSIPLSQVIDLVSWASGEAASGSQKQVFKTLKMIRFARILKLIRLMKAAKIFRILEEELDINVSVLKLFKLFFIVLFFSHLLGCLTYALANSQAPHVYGMFRPQEWWGCELCVNGCEVQWSEANGNATVFELDYATADSVFAPDPEIEVELLTGSPRAPQGFCADGRMVAKIEKGWLYLWVLYWTITTMTTIGYGDISPRTSLEVLLTIVVQLIGTVLFGWMLGNIANLLAEFNQYETAYKMRMEQIKAYLAYRKIPRAMKKRVQKFCGHYLTKKGVMRENWDMLPPRMRRELLKNEHAEFLTVFPNLRVEGKEDVLYRIADLVRPTALLAGAYFVDAAVDPCTEIAFIVEGEVVVLPKNHRVDRAGGGGESARASSESQLPKTPDARGRSWAMRLVPSAADPAKKTSASGAASATSAAPPGRNMTRQSTSFSSVLGVKRAGTWFGHTELLQVHEEVKETGIDTGMSSDTPWHYSYKARVPTELLLLVKDDVFVLLEEYPYLRDLLAIEPEIAPLRKRATHAPCVDSVSAAVSSSGVGVESIAEEDDRGEGTGAAGSRNPADSGRKPGSPLGAKLWGRVQGNSFVPELEPIDGSPSTSSDDAKVVRVMDAEGRVSTRSSMRSSTGHLAEDEVSESEGSAKARPSCAPLRSSGALLRNSSVSPSSATPSPPLRQPSQTCCGKYATSKSPNVLMQAGSSRQVSTTANAGSWKKLRQSKQAMMAARQRDVDASDDAQGSAKPMDDVDAAEHASLGTGDWLKQRLACDLLGDSLRAPWEIDEEELFQRLASLVQGAVAAPSGSETNQLALHQLLLSMQRQVQVNAEEVRNFLEVQLVSTPAPKGASAEE